MAEQQQAQSSLNRTPCSIYSRTRELWKNIEGYNGRYKVSSLGKVAKCWKSYTQFLKFEKNRRGYLRVALYNGKGKKKIYQVHRLVYLTFNDMEIEWKGFKGKCLVCHKDDDPNNPRLDNLFLGSMKDNAIDMSNKNRIGGACKKGEENAGAKLKEKQVKEIRKRYKLGERVVELSEEFGVKVSCIYSILSKRIWKHI